MGVKDSVLPGSEEDIDNSFSDLESAWDQLEEEGGDEGSPPEGSIQPKEGEAVPPAEPPEPAPEGEGAVPPAAEGGQPPAPAEGPVEKAPAGWRPEARELWKDLPPAAKQEILKRERDFAVGIQRFSESAQWANQFNNALQPFRPMFAANGQDDVTGVRNVLQVAATLQMGSTAQKVKVVADLIGQYGVDLVALDSYLADGEISQGRGPDPQLEQILQQRLAPIEQMYQQVQAAQRNQQMQSVQRANQTVAQFAQDPKNEFYNDVKMDMADLLDMAAARGVELSLDEAYRRACLMNPSISAIIQSRQTAESLPNKRKAASSVTGVPTAPPAPKAPDSTREALEAAWDAFERN